MPSPVGHTLAGLCGFILGRQHVAPHQRLQLLLASVAIANLPDIDILPGLLLAGDPRVFHRQGMHSLIVAALIGGLVALLVRRWKLPRIRWGIWAVGLYASHILLDMLTSDSRPPFGVQAFWPFSQAYFISPVSLFGGFDYFDPELSVIKTILSVHNFVTVLTEMVVIIPLAGLAWYWVNWTHEKLHASYLKQCRDNRRH